MKRVHVLEFEDLSWFPAWLRACMTHNLVILARVLGVGQVLSGLIAEALDRSGRTRIVDLGSGSGGVLPDLLSDLRRRTGGDVSLVLTDKYPSADVLRSIEARDVDGIRYVADPVDATRLETAPEGLKTMVNCFHHMRPGDARAILASAVSQRQPILIYEMGGHQLIPFGFWLLGLPIGLILVFASALVMSAFVRPATPRQLFFTYVIPLVPLFYAWDGQASMARIYRDADLDEILSGLEDVGYTWEKGRGRTERGRKLGSYLLGLPVEEGYRSRS